jgi:23S rRNA pseudoU1915 N3-methylase RlmH
MQIQILTVGKIKEKYLTQGINEYLKRLSAYAKVEIREVKDEKTPDNPSPTEVTQLLEKEAARIEPLLKHTPTQLSRPEPLFLLHDLPPSTFPPTFFRATLTRF